MSDPENEKREIAEKLHPTYSEKILNGMMAERAVKRITFDRSEANPGEKLYVSVPKLNGNEVLVPGSLELRFDIDLSKGNANNFLVQNVTRALVDQLVVKFASTTLQDTVGYDIYKTFEDLFVSQETREGMILEGIRSMQDPLRLGRQENLASRAENKLEDVFGKKYRIRLDHQILTDHSVFYPEALYNDLTFYISLAPAVQVVKGPEKTELKYKLTNIQLEYEMIRSNTLAEEAESVYLMGKEFAMTT